MLQPFPFTKANFARLIFSFFWIAGFAYSAASDPSDDDSLAWPAWRGDRFDGVAPKSTGTGPLKFDAENCQWKVELPGKSSSTPIVIKDKILLTTPIGDQDGVVCLNRQGEKIWQVTLGKNNPGKHRNGSGSNASPISDGEHVYVQFKSGTLAALDLDGSVIWKTNLIERFGPENLYWDAGTSPVLTEKHVIQVRMHEGPSWIAAFDKKTGDLAWRVDRNYSTPDECDNGYTTPIVLNYENRESILVWGAEHITIHDAVNGNVLFSCGGFNPDKNRLWPQVASPVIANDVVVIPYGRADRGNPLLFGVRLLGRGDVTQTNHLWKRSDIGTFVPTPAVYQNRVVVLGDRGELEMIDSETGRTIARSNFPHHRSNFYASPIVINNRIYAAREDGRIFVVDLINQDLKLVAENEMGESIIGSLVPLADGILIRGEKHLFFVGN